MTENPPRDWRMWLGVLFILGYYALAFTLLFIPVPEKNSDLVNNMLVTLGPPVGMIVGALFRSDRADETRASNTGRVMEAMAEQARATTAVAHAGGMTDPTTPSGTQADPLIVAGAPEGSPPVRTTPEEEPRP